MILPSSLYRNILRVLPGLTSLNGHPVRSSVQFAVEHGETSSKPLQKIPLPTSIQGYFPNDEVKIPLLTFLKEYFSRYDSTPRGENLLSYYTTASVLTFSINPNTDYSCRNISENIDLVDDPPKKILLQTNNLSEPYSKYNRNLLRCRDEGRRRELVSQGSLSIASFLDRLPQTEHLLESFSIDVIFHSGNQILFTVAGVFFEVKDGNQSTSVTRKTLRFFTRTMILVAPGGQIFQDDMIISNPNESLVQRYIRDVKKRSSQTIVTTALPATIPSTAALNSPEAILSEFKRQTGMNTSFARQCLDEFSWNFNSALSSFHVMHSANKIPMEAFSPE